VNENKREKDDEGVTDWVNDRLNERTNEWKKEVVSEGWMDGDDGWMREWKWVNERTNERNMDRGVTEWRMDGWKGVNERTIEWEKEVVREGWVDGEANNERWKESREEERMNDWMLGMIETMN